MENTKLRRVNRHAQDYTINGEGGQGTHFESRFSPHQTVLSIFSALAALVSHCMCQAAGHSHLQRLPYSSILAFPGPGMNQSQFFDNKNTSLPTCMSMTYMIFPIFGRSAHKPPSSQSWGDNISPSSSELCLPVSPLLVSTSIFQALSPLTLHTSQWVVYASA